MARAPARSYGPGPLAGHRLGLARRPARLQVVVVRAAGLARLAGELLPARALRRRPGRRRSASTGAQIAANGSFGSQPTCATVSWAPPTSSVRLSSLRQQRIGARRARAGTRARATLPPAPARRGRSRSGRRGRRSRRAASRARARPRDAADQLLVALLPEGQQVRLPAPGRGDVGDEAVVGAVQPALGEVTVADRGARDLARRSAA